MKFQSKLIKMTLLSVAFVIMSFSAVRAQDEYSFKVYNDTDYTIKKLFVAEAGQKTWKYFDIGKGIKPGVTTTIVWDESTNDEGCIQWFKAEYVDGVQSKPAKFDFCQDDLTLTFSR